MARKMNFQVKISIICPRRTSQIVCTGYKSKVGVGGRCRYQGIDNQCLHEIAKMMEIKYKKMIFGPRQTSKKTERGFGT